MNMIILIAAILFMIFAALIIHYRNFVKSNSEPFMLISNLLLLMTTITYVIYTKDLVDTTQKQAAMQLEQFQLDSRPSVFISGWGEFQKFPGMQTMRLILENVGKLPASFEEIEFTIIVGGKRTQFMRPDFQKPSVIFPGQKNIHLDIPVPDVFMPDIRANGGFQFECRINYHSLTDKPRQHKYSYFVKYDLRMKAPDSNTIDEYVLRQTDAE